MAGSFPTDVAVFSTRSILHARFERSRKSLRVAGAKVHPLPEGTFASGFITPALDNREAVAAAIRRMKLESGRMDRLAVLLPDPWFRINLLEIASLPDSHKQADEVVRWTLRRTMPIRPEEFRIAHQQVARSNGHPRVLVLAALEKSLATIESAFREQQIDVALIEPVGINIWNAIVAHEPATAEDRVFLYIREHDFTTAVFRGTTPLFIRSRNLTGERTLVQEVKLSASYLRNTVQTEKFAACYIAGSEIDDATARAISDELAAPPRTVLLNSYAECAPSVDPSGIQAELTACSGVFTV